MPTGLPQSWTFRDDKGQTATTRMFIKAGADAVAQEASAVAVKNALIGLSNAAIQSATGPDTEQSIARVYGANADFETVEDKAVFVYETAAGSIHKYQVPAPKAAIFLSDGETIDFTNALVIAYNTAVLAAACDRNGVLVTISVGGYRDKRKLKTRFNVITRNPTLTGQGL